MKKNKFILCLLVLFLWTACSKNKDRDLTGQENSASMNVNFNGDHKSIDIPEEILEGIRKEGAKTALQYPLSPSKIKGITRAVNPSEDQIVNAMRNAGTKYNIPFEILYGIGKHESNLTQFNSSGQPLISGDNGIGIMQVTPGQVGINFDIESLKWDYVYNIEAGAQVIISKWNYVSSRNPIGNNDRKILEHWYLTLWAYNGYSYMNNPNEYVNGPRQWCNSSICWTAAKPYQERINDAIQPKFGFRITALPSSQLPAYGSRPGIPYDGQVFNTPSPVHYTQEQVPVEPCKTCTPKKTNGRLLPGEYLDKGQSITSSDGKTILIHQTDGNVVQYDQYGWLWQTGTSGKTTTRFIMQTDGNLVLYNGNTPLWSSGTYNNTNAYFDIQGDCNLVIYKSNGSPLWATYKFCRNFPNGTYQIAAGHSGKCLDVAGFSTADGGNIQQYSCSGGNNQKWNISAAGNGYYKISSVHSGKCMDLAAFSTANGGNIQQWSCSNGDNQLWMLQPVGTNRYKLMAKSSKKVADVEGISTADLANVYQWDTTGACNQQWLFTAR